MEKGLQKEYEAFLEEWNALQTTLVLFDWDNETAAPENGAVRTAAVVGRISASYQTLLTSEKTGALLEKAKQSKGLSDTETRIFRIIEKERKRLAAIPEDEYRKFSELLSVSTGKWTQAKKKNDFSVFAPVLTEILETKKKFAALQAEPGQSAYDALLVQFEEDFPTRKLDRFFEALKLSMIPLVKKIRETGIQPPYDFLFRSYEIEKQRQFNRYLAAYLGFDFSRGVLAESEHPFTTSLHKDDVRITTHYYENNLESAIFSTIHETGHALFEFGNGDEVTQTPAAGGTCGVHESQSRLYENMLGRSEAFWTPLYKKLTELFPEQLSGIPLPAFICAINRSVPGPVRTEADELTYCLHIVIRYELEKELFDGSLDVYELETAWADKYEQYLGIRPKTAAEGVLQDIHWAMGEFGYFPSYALGNAMAAQLYHKMNTEFDIEKTLRDGKPGTIAAWLRERIHKYGASRSMEELLKEITGEPLNPVYYTDYLKRKYGGLYEDYVHSS